MTYPKSDQHFLVNGLVQGQLYGFAVKAKNFQTDYGEESAEVTATPAANGKY